MEWYAKLKKWFSNMDDSSNMIIDAHWSIQEPEDSKQKMLVTQENVPFPIGVNLKDDVIHISIYTNIETYKWAKDKKADKFRDLLVQNDESSFIKFVLAGRNDEIVLRVDLDTQYLNKSEFNTALSSLIHGGNWCLSKLEGVSYDMKEDMNEEKALATLKLGIQIDLNRGREKSNIIQDLVTAGMDRRLATELVFDVAAHPIVPKNGEGGGKEGEEEGEEDEKTEAYIH